MARRSRRKSSPLVIHVRGEGISVDATFTMSGLRVFAEARELLAPPPVLGDTIQQLPAQAATEGDGEHPHQHFTPENARAAAESMCDACLAAFSVAATAELSRRHGHDARAS